MKVQSNTNVKPYTKTVSTPKSPDLQNQNPSYDSIEISTDKTQEQNANDSYVMYIKEMVAKSRDNSALSNMLKNVSGQNKKSPSPEQVRRICMKIAARIKKGDKVPIKDIKYLLKNDPQLYQTAMMSKKHNDNPKRWKQLSPDEDDIALSNKFNENNSSESSGVCQSPSINVSASSSETN